MPEPEARKLHSKSGGKGLQKKLGPLKTWQWLAIGVGAGVVWYVYKKNSEGAGITGPEGSSGGESLLTPTGGGGEGGIGGGTLGGNPIPPIEAPIPPIGGGLPESPTPTPIGSPGSEALPFVHAAEPAANNPPTGAFSPAAQAAKEGVPGADKAKNRKNVYFNTEHSSPRYGQMFKVVKKKNGAIYHVYRKGESILVKAAKKALRQSAHVNHGHNAIKHARAKPAPIRGQHSPNIRHHTVQPHHTRAAPLAHRVRAVHAPARPGVPAVVGAGGTPQSTAPQPHIQPGGGPSYVAAANRKNVYFNTERGNPRYGRMFKIDGRGNHIYLN